MDNENELNQSRPADSAELDGPEVELCECGRLREDCTAAYGDSDHADVDHGNPFDGDYELDRQWEMEHGCL
jgi:hypothetical protein